MISYLCIKHYFFFRSFNALASCAHDLHEPEEVVFPLLDEEEELLLDLSELDVFEPVFDEELELEVELLLFFS